MAATPSARDSLTGRRGVDIGTSFTRAWNERTGKTTKRSKDYPNPEYYSLRYNFKPESIDSENPGTLTPMPGGDGHIFELERPSQQGDSHRFTAVEQPAKEWECVLLWDPVLQQLTLEKLESTLNLHHGGRGRGTQPPSSRPGRAKAADRALEDDLEKLVPGFSDAEGSPDDDVEMHTSMKEEEEEEAEEEAEAEAAEEAAEEEEEEEEDMEPVDVAPPPPPPPPPPSKAKPPKGKGRARAGATPRRERAYDDVEEEVLTFGEPTRRARPAPNPPPNPNPHAPPTPSQLLQPPRITYAGSDSDDSDDSDDGGQELGEELDAAALELELEQELEQAEAEAEAEADDDEGMEAVPFENGQHTTGRPLSLNELFGQSNDDSSSSDDSDDD